MKRGKSLVFEHDLWEQVERDYDVKGVEEQAANLPDSKMWVRLLRTTLRLFLWNRPTTIHPR